MGRKRSGLDVMEPAEMAAAKRATDLGVKQAQARPADPNLERRVREVVARSYPMRVWRDPDGHFVADAPDIDGCVGTGGPTDEAIEDLREAMASWIEARLIVGLAIPEPHPPDTSNFSGRLLLRMPKSLHRDLANAAEREGTSINQVIVALIAAGVGRGTMSA